MARDVNVGPAAEKKLERYGVWVKVEPRDVTRDLGGSVELTDLEPQAAGGSAGRASFSDEEEHLLDELESGVGHEVAAGTQVELESLDEQLSRPADDEQLPELELEDAVEVPLADDKPGAGGFDDLGAIETELSPGRSGAARQPEILSRIERELRSIRSDLSSLKKELADLRRPGAMAEPADAGLAAKPAFFEEEDDDTIALTGDELDNILNTADITEEAADVTPVEEELAPLDDAGLLSEQPDILADEEPVPAAASAAVPAGPELDAEPLEELEEVTDLDVELPDSAPAELVLDEAASAETAELPALDLEGIPEIEETGEAELEELPADELGEAEAAVDLEEIPAAEAGEPVLSTDDLADSDLAELEAVAEESAPSPGASIEIEFEPSMAPMEEASGAADVEQLEAVEDLEEVPELTEESPATAARAPRPERSSPARQPQPPAAGKTVMMNEPLKQDLAKVLKVIDELLDALPEKKIREFAKSEHFAVYRKLFEDLGLDSE